VKQAKALGISRGSVYSLPRRFRRPISPSCGAWTSCIWIIRSLAAGCSAIACVRRHQDRTPARRDVDEAHGDRGDLSQAEYIEADAGHKIYPYLLRNLPVTKPDQVWATDITYVPMAHALSISLQ